MATTGVDPAFIDTGVLIDAKIATRPFHQISLKALNDLRAKGTVLWISRQVMREYAVVLSRPQVFSNPLPIPDLIADLVYFQSHFLIAEDGPQVTSNLIHLLNTIPMGGKQIHDANIVATMQAHGLTHLLTGNAGDFQRFNSVITLLTIP